jgi:hypothetical protein
MPCSSTVEKQESVDVGSQFCIFANVVNLINESHVENASDGLTFSMLVLQRHSKGLSQTLGRLSSTGWQDSTVSERQQAEVKAIKQKRLNDGQSH